MNIVIENVSYHYGKKVALDSVSLDLTPGINLMLGPNGAGKSTLFLLLTGLLNAKSGLIKVNDFDYQKNRSSIMADMGVVFQQSTLDLDLSVQQNLLYFAALHGISPANALDNITPMLAQLELADRLKDKVRTLNGGHRRRVEIVRALIHQPKVLLLDEPTVGLDIESRALIIKHVRALGDSLGLCVLWATHLMDEVRERDNLIVINQGKINAQGITSQLCKKYNAPDVYQLYRQLTNNCEVM
ncbi:MAG: ABC-2 type transport system ATP-binding protein [Paraglaciecola sp.]|jgi:ABC-2 type transport system ATP-binding protein